MYDQIPIWIIAFLFCDYIISWYFLNCIALNKAYYWEHITVFTMEYCVQCARKHAWFSKCNFRIMHFNSHSVRELCHKYIYIHNTKYFRLSLLLQYHATWAKENFILCVDKPLGLVITLLYKATNFPFSYSTETLMWQCNHCGKAVSSRAQL